MIAFDQGGEGKGHYRELTVAQIRQQEGADHVEVLFLESARFYRLHKKSPAFDEALRLLQAGMAKGRILKVGFASMESDVIEEVHEPGPATTE